MGRPREVGYNGHTEYAEKLLEKMETVQQYARRHLKIATEKQKRNYDHKADRGGYKRGDPVWLYNPTKKSGISPKLQIYWEGPFVIIKRLSDVTYRIQQGPKTKPKVIHSN